MEVTRLGWQSGDEGMGPSVPAPQPRVWVSVASPRARVRSGAGGDALLGTALLARHSPADALEGALWLAGWEVHIPSPKCPSTDFGAGWLLVGAVLSTQGAQPLPARCQEHHPLRPPSADCGNQKCLQVSRAFGLL